MKIFGIYDLNYNEQCVKIGTMSEIINFLNIKPRNFDSAIRSNRLINKQYEILYLFNE